ncbi:MAG: flagellin [Planctomycetota bacterium]
MVGSVHYNPAEAASLRHHQAAARARDVSLYKLSTGNQVSRGKDDPAGLIAISDFSRQIEALNGFISSKERNAERLHTIEGYESSAGDLLLELQDIVITAANEGARSDEELEALQLQTDGILEAISHIYGSARFAGETLFNDSAESKLSSLGSITASIVTDKENNQSVHKLDSEVAQSAKNFEVASFTLNDLRSGGLLDLRGGNLELASDIISDAIEHNAGIRGGIGTRVQRLESELENHRIELESVTQARSLTRDTNFATETSELARQDILSKSALSTAQLARQIQADRVRGLLANLTTPFTR